jgi:sugar lactone lactonase YvrE
MNFLSGFIFYFTFVSIDCLTMKKMLFILQLFGFLMVAQPPAISYPYSLMLTVGEPIQPITPNNLGGAVIPGSIVSTFAGSGYTGAEDGVGTNATFNLPTVVTFDHSGNLFVVDRMNNKIRKITPNGAVSTYAGTGAFGSNDGPATTATFTYPDGAVFDSQNNLFISDQSNHKIRKIDPDGTVTTIAGTGSIGAADGIGTAASFYYPAGMAVDAFDNVYVADYGNNKIRKITPEGIVSTFAGTGAAGAVDGIADEAEFNGVTGVAVDNFGNVYAADYYNNKIRKIDPLGNVTTLAGSGAMGAEDGLGSSASFYYPAIVSVDATNALYVTDEENHKIRKISPIGEVSTYAGDGTLGSNEGIATAAQFNYPTGVTIDANENVFVCDYGNNKIRKIREYGYTITPTLPEGLAFNPGTGSITGTPTAITEATDFTITASNPEGSSSFVLNITVGQLELQNFTSTTINLFPNPVKDELKVSSSQPINEIILYNALGQEIMIKQGQSYATEMNTSQLSRGWYFISIKVDDTLHYYKILKQ